MTLLKLNVCHFDVELDVIFLSGCLMPLLLFLMIFLLILMSPSDDQAILIPLSMSLFGSLLPKCLNTRFNLNPTYH